MKVNYFSNSQALQHISFSKITKLATHGLTLFFPRVSSTIALKYLCNPNGRREYNFRTTVSPEVIDLTIDMGEIKLFHFKGGDKHIFLTHGWADNTNRFTTLINDLLENGYSVWSIDHIGHGKSHGRTSHLYGYIKGLNQAFDYIKDQNIILSKVVSHSMGGVALLSIDKEKYNHAKTIIISAPAYFFDGMYKTISQKGISKNTLTNLLEKISVENNIEWQSLRPQNHKDKLNEDFLFIHDEHDEVAQINGIRELITESKAKLISTKGLGHLKILKDKEVIANIVHF